MADNVLLSLGFLKKENPYTDGEAWTHQRAAGRFYFCLTPEAVAEALIEIGHCEYRRRAVAAVSSIDIGAESR